MRWFFRRLAAALGTSWAIASLVFLFTRFTLSGPDQEFSRADNMGGGGAASVEQAERGRQALRERLGLDVPLFYVSQGPTGWQWTGTRNQYHRWASGVLHGDLGTSYRDGQPVTTSLFQALCFTIPLVSAAILGAVGGAVGLGLYLTSGPKSRARAIIRAGLGVVHIVPPFLLALALLLLLANPDMLNIVPVDMGDGPPTGLASVGYWASRGLLPVLVLVLSTLAELTLPLEAGLRHELQLPYARTAFAKGLSTSQVLRRHALLNALLPLITSIAGLLPALVSGAVVVEVIYALPGSGRLLAEAAAAHDFPVLAGGVLLLAVAKQGSQLLADGVQRTLDPRMK
jgi:peptide/nickel transport system permease protein